MSDYYVYSTLSQDNLYTVYKAGRNPAEPRIKDKQVLIRGGAGVINKNFVTPRGTVTKITAEELKVLMGDNPTDEKSGSVTFKRHIARGFIIVEKIKTNPAKVAKDMTERDMGAVATLKEIHERGAPDAKPKD